MTFFVKHCYDDFAWFPLIEHFRLLWNSTLFCILPLKHQQKLCMNNSRVTQRIIDPLSSNIKRGWDSSNAIAGKHESRLSRAFKFPNFSLRLTKFFDLSAVFIFYYWEFYYWEVLLTDHFFFYFLHTPSSSLGRWIVHLSLSLSFSNGSIFNNLISRTSLSWHEKIRMWRRFVIYIAILFHFHICDT